MHRSNEISSARVEDLRRRLQPLLDRVAAETGLALGIGKITYSRHNAVFAIEAAVRGPGGITMGREAEAFLANAPQFGLEPGDLGRDFQHLDTWYRIVGMKPRSKTPVVCQRIEPPSTFQTLFPAQVVRRHMESDGHRVRPSPHARIQVQIGEAPPSDSAATT